MKLLIDARLLNSGGIGRYLKELIWRWLLEPELEEIRLLGVPGTLENWLEGRPGAERVRILPWQDPIYSPAAQLRWMRRGGDWSHGADAVFFPHWDAPAVPGGPPRLLAVHDLIHFLEPSGFPLWKRIPGRILVGRALAAADRIVTVSEATARDLRRVFPRTAGRIAVVPNGVSRERFSPFPSAEREEVIARWTSHRPFLLYVGPLKPHKGVATALRALGDLSREIPELRIVHVGPTEVRDPEVAHLLADPAIASRYRALGELEDVGLREAYAACECLIHPARMEGFGLPPLEAFAMGTPVITSNRTSLPEVAGDAAILLDPDRPGEWSAAIREVLRNSALRSDLIRRGEVRAGQLTWDRAARETLSLLADLS